LTTKIVALVDALGNLARFVLLPGQAHDLKGVEPLIEGVCFGAFLGDKAFDANWLLAELDERGAMAVIPPKANRKIKRVYDKIIQGIPRNCNTLRQNGHKLCRKPKPRCSNHRSTVNVHGP
jgi:transposase